MRTAFPRRTAGLSNQAKRASEPQWGAAARSGTEARPPQAFRDWTRYGDRNLPRRAHGLGAAIGSRDGEGSRPISRVLSRTIIHLGPVSPPASSDLPESAAGHSQRIPIWSCSEWGLPSPPLLPAARCALTAPFHPYPGTGARAVYFLLHFPWAHAPQALPGTLPCGARTFLCSRGSTRARSDRLADSARRVAMAPGRRKAARQALRVDRGSARAARRAAGF